MTKIEITSQFATSQDPITEHPATYWTLSRPTRPLRPVKFGNALMSVVRLQPGAKHIWIGLYDKPMFGPRTRVRISPPRCLFEIELLEEAATVGMFQPENRGRYHWLPIPLRRVIERWALSTGRTQAWDLHRGFADAEFV